MSNPYAKYKKASVSSASREKILLMLYEATIKHVKKAMIAIDNNDISERGLHIGKAFDILLELSSTLNHDVGGEISKNLENLYMFITDQLTQANITGDKAHLESSLKILTTLYNGWQEAISSMKQKPDQIAK